MAQLEDVLVVGAVGLAGEGLSSGFKACRRFGKGWLPSASCIGYGARHASRPDGIELVGVKENLSFQAHWPLGWIAEAVGADAVLHLLDPVGLPAKASKHLGCKRSGGMVVAFPPGCFSFWWGGVMEQHRSLKDFQVRAFRLTYSHSQT